MEIDGQPIELGGGRAEISAAIEKTITGENFEMRVTIDDADEKVAGPYQDIVFITVDAN